MREDWNKVNLGSVCNLVGGGTPSKAKSEYYNGLIPWATVRDMKLEVLNDTELKINQEAVRNSSTNIISKGNVIIATRVGLGKVCLLNQDTAINQDLKGVIPKTNKIIPKFIFWWFKSISDEIINAGTGLTVQGVKLQFVNKLQFPLIPLQEQQKIVAILDEAFEAINQAKANIEKNIANAQELFQSKLNEIFSQRGEGWEVSLLNEICEVKDGTHDSPKYVNEENGIHFVTQKNILEDGLSFENTKFISLDDHDNFYRRSNVAENDILFSMIGANRGMVCIVDDDRTFSIKNVGLIKSSDNYRSKYLLYFLKSPIARNYVSNNSSGSAQGFIGLGKLRAFPIPMTAIDKQKTIEIILDNVNDNIVQAIIAYQMKIKSLEELKKSILQKAFAGELTNKEVEGLQLAAEPEERY